MEEVQQALFEMDDTKALGLNGMPALFFKKFWFIVGVAVMLVVLNILNNEKDLGC